MLSGSRQHNRQAFELDSWSRLCWGKLAFNSWRARGKNTEEEQQPIQWPSKVLLPGSSCSHMSICFFLLPQPKLPKERRQSRLPLLSVRACVHVRQTGDKKEGARRRKRRVVVMRGIQDKGMWMERVRRLANRRENGNVECMCERRGGGIKSPKGLVFLLFVSWRGEREWRSTGGSFVSRYMQQARGCTVALATEPGREGKGERESSEWADALVTYSEDTYNYICYIHILLEL